MIYIYEYKYIVKASEGSARTCRVCLPAQFYCFIKLLFNLQQGAKENVTKCCKPKDKSLSVKCKPKERRIK